MKLTWIILLLIINIIGICEGYGIWNGAWMDWSGEQCEAAIKEVVNEDRATIVDDSPNRLHATWLSQECEVRAGPEYIIRKYTFYKNGTFLLIRHHYAEESCSVATHTVTARGVIRLLSSSGLAPGATEAKYQLDHVHIIPLTRQVAHKFGHRVNVSCTPQPRWRAYGVHIIYESQSSQRSLNLNWEKPTYYLFKRSQQRKHHWSGGNLNCLESLGIDFNELKLIRVEKKPATSTAFGLGLNGHPRVELLLASLPPNIYSKQFHRASSLQPNTLIRSDTTRGCLVCGAISRATESSPPLLHQVAALPALLGGSWISSSCESCEGGVWIKRQLQFYSGDVLWTGRWDYYSDPKCYNFLYAVTAAGSYIQRTGRQKRHEISSSNYDNDDTSEISLFSSSLKDDVSSSSETIINNGNDEFFDDNVNDYVIRSKRNSKIKNYSTDDKWDFDWITSDSAKLLDIFGSSSLRMPLPKNLFNKNTPSSKNNFNIINKQNNNNDKIEISQTITVTTKSLLSNTTTTPSDTIISSTTNDNLWDRIENDDDDDINKAVIDNSYRHLFKNYQPSMAQSFTLMLRGNQQHDEKLSEESKISTKKPSPVVSQIPAGTTELDLHVAESLLIAGDLSIAHRCGATIDDNDHGGFIIRPLNIWPRNCVKHALEAPSTLGLRARIGVNWSGQYTLLLGPRDDSLWEAPLRQCGSTPAYNNQLRSHLRLSLGYRYGLFISSSSSSSSS
ncbi:uncharacterized protein LOC103573665, partial [Microplitis demolitor]|uniref:uncharacterized protein LOC103573665 n=1 Tax=Microplitis demolitor TaxID=69319 RepID=UPI00235B5EED